MVAEKVAANQFGPDLECRPFDSWSPRGSIIQRLMADQIIFTCIGSLDCLHHHTCPKGAFVHNGFLSEPGPNPQKTTFYPMGHAHLFFFFYSFAGQKFQSFPFLKRDYKLVLSYLYWINFMDLVGGCNCR